MKSIITAKSAIGISTRGRSKGLCESLFLFLIKKTLKFPSAVIARPESPPLNLELVAQHSQLLRSPLLPLPPLFSFTISYSFSPPAVCLQNNFRFSLLHSLYL